MAVMRVEVLGFVLSRLQAGTFSLAPPGFQTRYSRELAGHHNSSIKSFILTGQGDDEIEREKVKVR